MGPEVVPKKCGIQLSATDIRLWQKLFEPRCEPFCQAGTPGLQTHKVSLRKIVVLNQLVGQSIEDERKLRRGDQNLVLHFKGQRYEQKKGGPLGLLSY
jgi:hypothetical protein